MIHRTYHSTGFYDLIFRVRQNQTAEDITQAVWVPIEEVSGKLEESYPSLKALWEEIKNL